MINFHKIKKYQYFFFLKLQNSKIIKLLKLKKKNIKNYSSSFSKCENK